MKHEQEEEVLGRDGSGPVFSAFGMAKTKDDHAFPALQNILLADNAPVQVAAKINKGLFVVAHVLAVNHSLFGAIREVTCRLVVNQDQSVISHP